MHAHGLCGAIASSNTAAIAKGISASIVDVSHQRASSDLLHGSMDANTPECKPLKEKYDACFSEWRQGRYGLFGLSRCDGVFAVSCSPQPCMIDRC